MILPKLCCVLALLLTSFFVSWPHHSLVAQNDTSIKAELYWVFFVDKPNVHFYAQQNFSAKAIERRIHLNIPFDVFDQPVCASYIDSLRACGAKIRTTSRWLNAASIEAVPTALEAISQLYFINELRALHPVHSTSAAHISTCNIPTGKAQRQLKMLGIDKLHDLGLTGKGVRVAVIDDGFVTVDTHEAFKCMRDEGRLLGHYDFVNKEDNVFNRGTHGLRVFSVMGTQWSTEFRGGAPDAEYILLHSEDGSQESRIEEDYWTAAAEWADSAGAQLIQSSLVYNTFDDRTTNYTRKDLDGKTATITRAAQKAASRGILVVNSAGNERSGPWHYILPPSDGDSVCAVGSVNFRNESSSFSCVGPTYDGRLKPDLVAPGEGVTVVGSDGNAATGNGTSFSAPLVSSLAACLMQEFAKIKPMEIIECLRQSADRAANPDTLVGWGVPNGEKAKGCLAKITYINQPLLSIQTGLYPNPANDILFLDLDTSNVSQQIQIDWYTSQGACVKSETHTLNPSQTRLYWNVSELQLPSGTYYLHFSTNNQSLWLKPIVIYQP